MNRSSRLGKRARMVPQGRTGGDDEKGRASSSPRTRTISKEVCCCCIRGKKPREGRAFEYEDVSLVFPAPPFLFPFVRSFFCFPLFLFFFAPEATRVDFRMGRWRGRGRPVPTHRGVYGKKNRLNPLRREHPRSVSWKGVGIKKECCDSSKCLVCFGH